jgi:hypothetical protein
MAVLDAVVEDIDFLIISHKQNSRNLIAQSAIWLGEITVFFKGFLRECIERMETLEITAIASYSRSLRKSSSFMPSCLMIS